MIDITPHLARDVQDNEIDAGIDAIWWNDRGVKRRVGFIGRSKNAPVQLIVEGLAPVVIKAITKAAEERDFSDVPDEFRDEAASQVREVQSPPKLEDIEKVSE